MSLTILGDPHEMQRWSLQQKAEGKTVGFVPTMGALHEGHFKLVETSLAQNDVTAVSIFVNPTQFNDPEDFKNYPRQDDKDLKRLKEFNVDVAFVPTPSAMYPSGRDMRVEEEELSSMLCGAHRPGHFSGMLTVVLKLLGLAQPTRAYFGAKDFQQLLLVEKLVKSFFLPVEIVRVPTVRSEDGVALSSRNERLPASLKEHLASFPKILRSARSDEDAANELKARGFEVDYVTSFSNFRHGAVHLGGVRFIDHVEM